jgi:serine/threonine-protein kinase RIO1
MRAEDCKETSESEEGHQSEIDAESSGAPAVKADAEQSDVTELTPSKQRSQERNAWGVSSREISQPSTQPSRPNKNDETTVSNQPKPVSFATIMAEQISDSEHRKAENIRSTRVKFCEEVESEEERMMRLAIEASLRDQQHDYFHLEPHSVKKSALKNGAGGMKVDESHVSFATNDFTIDAIGEDMDEDMKMAIALSLQDANAVVTFDDEEDGDKKPSAKDCKDAEKMSAAPSHFDQDIHINIPPATAFASASSAASSNIAESKEDESEQLARALYNAELAEFKSLNAAAEEASLELAKKLQKEEDDRLRNNLGHEQYSDAARLKREEMCRGGGRGGAGADIGVRTVNRDEFNKMKGDGKTHVLTKERIKAEEKGMGKFLRSSGQFDDNTDVPYFYPGYAAEQIDYDDDDDYGQEEYEEEGIRMNPQSTTCASWRRLDKNTFMGSNNEVRTKHDPELVKSANATKLKDAYSIGSSSVSDSAYNSFKRAEARQTGMKKGVAKQGHGRAENMNAGKTRGGAMDGPVRLQIAAAINQGLIERCNGVVKEGKEALVYHAEGKIVQHTEISADPDVVGSDGFDLAVKVFKRISEFKGRGAYVDGDPRFHKQKFKSNDQREQVVLWAEKEYRNLIRAHRGGVRVPLPLRQRENVLFMRFLGDNGWPSPQLREVEIKKGSDRWTVLYCETIAAIRR